MTRTLPALALVALLAVSLAPTLAAATPCPSTPVVNITNGSVSATQSYSCKEIHVTGTWTIGGGGRLTLDRVTLVTDGSGDAAISVDGGGTLVASNSTFGAGGASYTLKVGPTGHATLQDMAISGYKSFTIAGSDVLLARAQLTSQVAAEGLHVAAASPTLRQVTLASPVTGLLVDGASTPQATGLAVTHASYAALSLAGPARAVLESSSLQSDLVGAILQGASTATLQNSTIQGATSVAQLVHAPDGDPLLDLRSTPADIARVERSAAATLRVGWYARAKVSAPDARIHLAQARVQWVDANGIPRGNGTVDASGVSTAAFLPDVTYKGPGATPLESRNDYRAIARGGPIGERSSAGSTGATVKADRTGPAAQIPVTLPFDLDGAPPTWADAAHALALGAAVSGDGNVTLTWSGADDTVGGAYPNRQVAYYEVQRVSAGVGIPIVQFGASPGTITGLQPGNHTFYVYARDLVGLRSNASNMVTVRVDTAKAAITVNATPVPHLMTDGAWYFNDTFSIAATAARTDSGVPTLDQRVGGVGAAFAPHTAPIPFSVEGTNNVTFRSTSSSGVQQSLTRLYVLDRQPPLLDVQIDPLVPDGADGWRVHPLKLTATAADDGPSGIDRIQVRDGSGGWQDVNGTFTLSSGGDRLVQVRALDRSGNSAATALHARIDADPPTLKLTATGPTGRSGWFTGGTRLAINATDAASGITRLAYSLGDGPWNDVATALQLNGTGTWRVQVRAQDAAGNLATAQQLVAIDGDPPIPPQPDLTPQGDGRLRVDWSQAPPLDAVSGLASVTLERTTTNGSAQRLALRLDSASQAVGPLPAGEQTVRLVAVDLAGNQAATPWVRVRIPQHASADTPLAVRGIQAITYTPDPGFQPGEVRFLVDGELRTTRTEAPYAYQWDTRSAADGQHQVRIVAVDKLGAQTEQALLYQVRNAYLSSLADGALPFAAAAGLGLLGGGLAVTSFLLRRRWFPA